MNKTDLYLEPILEKLCLEVAPDSLLDVGCGSDSPIRRFSKKIPRCVGIDGFLPSIEKASDQKIHHEYLHGDLLKSLAELPSKSFDIAIAIDVIEHFDKKDGWTLWAEMERLARKRVVIFTPNGFLPQGEYDTNPHQLHRSGWVTSEFADRGYQVCGINGLKFLKGERALPRIKPRWLGNRLSDYTQFFTYSRPKWAFQILATKTF